MCVAKSYRLLAIEYAKAKILIFYVAAYLASNVVFAINVVVSARLVLQVSGSGMVVMMAIMKLNMMIAGT